MSWGDMDENGHPISKDKGKSYVRWVNNVCKYGYYFDWRILNAADFGAYTCRKRFFGLFALHGLPIAFPKATHAKCPAKYEHSLFSADNMQPWKPVHEVLDLNDEGVSIFGRKKPLVENTLERIYAGLIKFVAGGKKQHEAWILKYNSMNRQNHHNAPSIEEPCPTVATQNRLGVVKVSYLSKQFSGEPESKNISVEGPAGAITTIDHHALVSASLLDMQYGNGTPSSVERPAPTATTNPKYQLVTADHWLMDTSFNNFGSSIEEPSRVITANRKWHYLMSPQFASKGGSVDSPYFTLIARMDKMPPYLINTEEGVGIEVYESDSPMTVKIKEFMAAYGIYDIKMRMLNIQELKRIMGFPEDYTLIGSQSEQKKFIGNAVEVNMARVLCEALFEKLSQN